METAKELKVTVVRVDVVDSGNEGGVVHVFPSSTDDCYTVANEDQEAPF